MTIKSSNIPAPDRYKVRRALLSVSDKTGIVDFARALSSHGVELISTGGTARILAEAGLAVSDVAEITGFPEIMDGRVKTLHPAIHGGLLAIRDDPDHRGAMDRHAIAGIDLVAINLYPFEDTIAGNADFATAIENIDIGGPAMIRAAAKNHAYVAVIADPHDYAEVLAAMEEDGSTPFELRRRLASRAFARTAAYDAAVSTWFAGTLGIAAPRHISFAGEIADELRYGENPHQRAALYLTGDKRPGVATARQLQGKQLSYNNINDTDAAFELVSEFASDEAAVVAIIKHANPCGVAAAGNLAEAWSRALACDPVSAFGGIVAVNRTLDLETASRIARIFTEVIIAPGIEPAAAEFLAAKRNLRVLLTGALADPGAPGMVARTIAGGLLVQSRDNLSVDGMELKIVTRRAPDERELADLRFAFKVAKHVKSNAIVYARNGATVGIGAGQMSRVDSSRIAARKAEDAAAVAGGEPMTRGSAVASDAFFPFADGLVSAIEAGATAVIQPGGSVRDDEVIAAADAAGIAMVFTGIRHFRH